MTSAGVPQLCVVTVRMWSGDLTHERAGLPPDPQAGLAGLKGRTRPGCSAKLAGTEPAGMWSVRYRLSAQDHWLTSATSPPATGSCNTKSGQPSRPVGLCGGSVVIAVTSRVNRSGDPH